MPDDQAPESLGSWMRQRRKALDLTQAALADRVGCAHVTIRKLEAELRRPSRQLAERLAVCLEIPADERAVFVQVVRGERRPDRVSSLPLPSDAVPRSGAPISPDPLLRDWVPLPAPLPPGSRMPLSRNPLFVGRDGDLRDLAYILHAGGTAAIGQVEIAAATGLGGIGKTQLACEFVHRYGQFFAGGVFWLSFADPAVVPAEVAACGGNAGMDLRPDFDTLPLEKQVSLVRAVWHQPIARLLVFDNCEDEALLEQWRPAHGGCRVLLTSRRQHWNAVLGVQILPLDVLSRAESLALLRQFRPDLPADHADLDAIAEALGDLPLALHMAGSFLAKYRHAVTPAQYRARLHTPTLLDDRSLQAAGVSPTHHVQHVARTFEQSYARLDAADPTDALARMLLAHAACCAPGEPLPRPFLLHTLDLPEADAACTLRAEDALTRLLDMGLLTTDDAGNLRLHRLVAAFARTVLVDDAVQAAVEATMLRLADTWNKSRNPRPLLAVQPHLRFLTEAAQGRADERAAGLCNALGTHLRFIGVYGEAQDYHEQALAINQRALGANHSRTAETLNNLGTVFWSQGQYAVAQGYYAQALAIWQQALGPDHPDTARSLNNLGEALREQGQYAQAQTYYVQALRIFAQVLGSNHPHTAASLNNLGLVLLEQGQYAEARCAHEQALAIRQRVLPADHPDTASSLNNLAEVLKAQGQYAQAQHVYAQALAILERVLGPDHPNTATILHNLGLLLHDQGQYAQAQHYHEQALAIRQQMLGPDHPDTARSLSGLGELRYMQGKTDHARRYLDQALAVFAEQLGPQHPDTARSLHTLGMVLQTERQYAAARGYVEQALVIYEQAVGAEHPSTQRVRASLAAILEQHRKR